MTSVLFILITKLICMKFARSDSKNSVNPNFSHLLVKRILSYFTKFRQLVKFLLQYYFFKAKYLNFFVLTMAYQTKHRKKLKKKIFWLNYFCCIQTFFYFSCKLHISKHLFTFLLENKFRRCKKKCSFCRLLQMIIL